MEQQEVIVKGKGALREGNEATDIRAAARSVLLLVLEKHGNEELPLRLEERSLLQVRVHRLVELEDSRLFICFYKIFSLVSHLNQRPQDKTENIEIAWTIFKSFWEKECWGIMELYLKKLELQVRHPSLDNQPNIADSKGGVILREHQYLLNNIDNFADRRDGKIILNLTSPLLERDKKIELFAKENKFDLNPKAATTNSQLQTALISSELNFTWNKEKETTRFDNQDHDQKLPLTIKTASPAIEKAPLSARPVSLPVAVTIVSCWTIFVTAGSLTMLAAKKVTPANTRTTDTVPPPRVLSINSSPLVVDNPPPRNPSRTCSVKSITLINLAFRHDHRHMPPCDYDNNCKSTLIAALDSDRQNRTRLLFHCPTQTCTWSSTPTTDGSNVVISVTDANTGSGRHRHGSRRFHITVTTCGTITSTY